MKNQRIYFQYSSILLIVLFAQLTYSQSGLYSIETGHTITKIRVATKANDNYLVGSSFEGKIIAIDYDQTILWTNDLSGFMNHDIWCDDLTGDGVDEILAANADGSIYCLNSNGELLWEFKPNDAPMYSVCVLDHNGTSYVVCGGYDKNIYYVSSSGNVVKTLPSNTYSEETTWGNTAPPSHQHISNFLRVLPQADGTEDLVVHAVLNSLQAKGAIYLFEAMADLPYNRTVLNNQKPIGDVRVSDYFGDGQEEILGGHSGVHNNVELHKYVANTDAVELCNLKQRKNDLGGFGYRVVQSEVIPLGNSFVYFTLIGKNIMLVLPDFNVDNGEIISCDYAFHDMWHDKVNNKIILASSQSGGSSVHVIDYTHSNWKTEYENIAPPGKIQDILSNTQTIRDQLENFVPPSWERSPKPVYFVTDLQSNTANNIKAIINDIQANYDSPIFLGTKHMPKVQDPADWNRDTMSNAFYQNTRDSRKSYELTQGEVMGLLTPVYDEFNSLCTWGGHGNDPYFYSIHTKKALLDYANGRKTVLIYPELEKDNEDFEYVLNDLIYPLAEYADSRNAQIHLRTKHMFWQGPAHRPLWSRLSSGEFADVFVPSMEETTDKSQELSITGRMGYWMSGAVNQWGTRAVPDNASFDRLRQFSNQQLPNHFLRQLVYTISSGATHLNNFPVNREYLSLVWELIAKGALYVPDREDLLNISPVHLSMSPDPDPYYLNEGGNVKWLTFFDEENEENNKLVFSHLNGTWPGAPLTDWDFSNYAANETERRLNYIPSYNNGLVLITPVQHGTLAVNDLPRGKLTDHMHPYYQNIMREYITDGRNYISSDGSQSYPAETYFNTVKSKIENSASLLPLTVSGDVGWVVAQTDSLHLRLTIIDGGYLNPGDKTATVHFHTANPVSMTDLLDGTTFEVSNSNSIEVDIPCGLFRFFDVQLSEPLAIPTVPVNQVEKEERAFRIFPNPTQDSLNVAFFTTKRKTGLQITDNVGKVVKRWEIATIPNKLNQVVLNLNDLASGVYHIKVEGSRHSERLVLQR